MIQKLKFICKYFINKEKLKFVNKHFNIFGKCKIIYFEVDIFLTRKENNFILKMWTFFSSYKNEIFSFIFLEIVTIMKNKMLIRLDYKFYSIDITLTMRRKKLCSKIYFSI